ncbi:DEAD/DEAH box helicase family protein [Mycobacterium kansasii 732]|uniref:exonuclease domain-containing protein n=1 Tax=Mycobacterium pseudokansasii TaxID=2341080 RepID=UPI00044EE417|nr:exonuclease domain-containing protein [Mycobacterium pseudokansasii]EUA15549.1 DEAD/DEAH box helicase family protein [Mycobacterium kansasii 732]MBY0388103.1 hypothetical protein [Mycobacterium pseudokansasii]
MVQLPAGVARPNESLGAEFPLDDALRLLEAHLAEIDLVIGHNLLEFDRPLLHKAAERAGIDPPHLPSCVDSLHLATLFDAAMPNRSLADLTHQFNIDHQEPHRALADATATAGVVRAMLDAIDVEEPSWQLAIGVLEAFDHPLVSLLPGLTATPELSTSTRPPDPLLIPSGSPAADAFSAARDAFAVLQARHQLLPREAQQQMARAVADVFDHGGRLAVEAPTGTGKSLAYLLPALGRASRPAQPVVIATVTKALQSQLRDEATRLYTDGLLGAPFRQIQGVGNYVCTRELEDALSDRESSPLALAVALRAIAASPTGTWDDVTDDVIRRRDTRYARTRARLRTNAGGCDRTKCVWAQVCPLTQQLNGLDKTPGVVSVNHALIANWVKTDHAPGDVLAESRADLVVDEAVTVADGQVWGHQANLRPGATDARRMDSTTTLPRDHGVIDREGHFGPDASRCSYCGGRICPVCLRGMVSCDCCATPICQRCVNKPKEELWLCPACATLRRATRREARQHGRFLLTRGMLIGTDPVHTVVVEHTKHRWMRQAEDGAQSVIASPAVEGFLNERLADGDD